jgi:hypothetical protein
LTKNEIAVPLVKTNPQITQITQIMIKICEI